MLSGLDETLMHQGPLPFAQALLSDHRFYDRYVRDVTARLTWQATPRNKISVFADAAPQATWNRGYQSAVPIAPGATTYGLSLLPGALGGWPST